MSLMRSAMSKPAVIIFLEPNGGQEAATYNRTRGRSPDGLVGYTQNKA
jgi:hypothetical protein